MFLCLFQARDAGSTRKAEGRRSVSSKAINGRRNGQFLFRNLAAFFAINLVYLHKSYCDCNPMAGSSYERASSAKGRNGVLVQDWGHGGLIQKSQYLSSSSVSFFNSVINVTFFAIILIHVGCGCYSEKVGSRCSHVILSFWLSYNIF